MTPRAIDNRGYALVSLYFLLVLAFGLLHLFAMRGMTHTAHTDRHIQTTQARDLAQAGIEQFRRDLHKFFDEKVVRAPVSQQGYAGDALSAMAWLDALETHVQGGSSEAPAFDPYAGTGPAQMMPFRSADLPLPPQGALGTFEVTLFGANPVRSSTAAQCAAAHDCDVTIVSTGRVGGVARAIKATLRFALSPSEVFRYLYFVNNFGYFRGNPARYDIRLHGDIRSNGDFEVAYVNTVNGDIAAAANPDLPGSPDGEIALDAGSVGSWDFEHYLNPGYNPTLFRPADPYLREQAGAVPTDLDHPELGPFIGYKGSLGVKSGETPLQMPVLRDLSLYAAAAANHNGGQGSLLRYWDLGADNTVNTADDREITITGAYDGVGDYYRRNDGSYWSSTQPLSAGGPDGAVGNADDLTLIIRGKWDACAHPGPVACGRVMIDGPVLVPNDAIVAGGIWQGQGMVYAGRNVHITGTIWHQGNDLPKYPLVQQSTTDAGTFRVKCDNDSAQLTSPNGSLEEVQTWAVANCP